MKVKLKRLNEHYLTEEGDGRIQENGCFHFNKNSDRFKEVYHTLKNIDTTGMRKYAIDGIGSYGINISNFIKENDKYLDGYFIQSGNIAAYMGIIGHCDKLREIFSTILKSDDNVEFDDKLNNVFNIIDFMSMELDYKSLIHALFPLLREIASEREPCLTIFSLGCSILREYCDTSILLDFLNSDDLLDKFCFSLHDSHSAVYNFIEYGVNDDKVISCMYKYDLWRYIHDSDHNWGMLLCNNKKLINDYIITKGYQSRGACWYLLHESPQLRYVILENIKEINEAQNIIAR